MKKHFITLLLVMALAITCLSQTVTTGLIKENALRARIKFLSDDRLEGRGTGARGGELAALYCAEQFEALGLKGAGPNGSYWQPVSLFGVKADPKTQLIINNGQKTENFKFGDDYVAFTGAQEANVIVQ